jgi:hypothetical protein
MPIPIEQITQAKLPNELTDGEKASIANALETYQQVDEQTATVNGSTIVVTIGKPSVIAVNGIIQNADISTWTSTLTTVTGVNYLIGDKIRVYYNKFWE